MTFCPVAIEAEDLEDVWEIIADDPQIPRKSSELQSDFSAVFVAASMDMVKR